MQTNRWILLLSIPHAQRRLNTCCKTCVLEHVFKETSAVWRLWGISVLILLHKSSFDIMRSYDTDSCKTYRQMHVSLDLWRSAYPQFQCSCVLMTKMTWLWTLRYIRRKNHLKKQSRSLTGFVMNWCCCLRWPGSKYLHCSIPAPSPRAQTHNAVCFQKDIWST